MREYFLCYQQKQLFHMNCPQILCSVDFWCLALLRISFIGSSHLLTQCDFFVALCNIVLLALIREAAHNVCLFITGFKPARHVSNYMN